PVSAGGTPMCDGLRKTAELLVTWCDGHPSSYPPTIIHVTDGQSTDGDPEQIADMLKRISTQDGPCLLFNLHIDASGTGSLIFPQSETTLPDTYSKLLFRMSSSFPAHLIKPATD